MHVHFLFPSHPLRPTVVEEMFAEQYEAVTSAGFPASVIPDVVVREGRPLQGRPVGMTVVYRGWMLNAAEYAGLVHAIESAGAIPLTPLASYLTAHHLPNWYPLIAEFTPKTCVLPLEADWEAELRSLGWDAFFVKDYVKSVKTSVGSVIRDPSEIGTVVAEMRRIRGEIEGGLCVRQVEPFLVDTERRYFVIYGRAFSPDGGAVPDLVREVAGRIPSRFFSVDVIQRADGMLRVVEVGDGQVSDLVGWSAAVFAAVWSEVVRE